jgi:4-amino-4-deoxy-L-arabinose transferase-like glycosyltransferase
LHFWNYLAGPNAFAGRFVSLFFGVLTVALMYRIGKKVGGKWIGLLAALFLAIARFHIWWSQDIKNYTPSIFFVFVAVWFGLQILEISNFDKNRNLEFGYALFAALALWTHYLAALVLIAFNLYALLRFTFYALRPTQQATRIKESFIRWLIANLIAAALFAPWLYLYLQNAAMWTAAPAFDFGLFLKLVATVLPLGVTTNIDDYAGLTIAFTTLAALGCLWVFGNSKFTNRTQHASRITSSTRITSYVLLFILIVLFPPLLVYALSLTPVSFFAPKIQARYLLILLPAYTILLALGLVFLSRLSRVFAAFAFLALLAVNIFVLNDYYAERRLTDEYTTLANTINSFARQGDLVLLDTDQEWPTFLYYLRAPLDWLGVPNGKPMTESDADALVRRALNRHTAIWLVTIPDALATDPQKMIESRIAGELPRRFAQTFDDKRLVLYTRDDRDLISVAPENFAPQYPRQLMIDEDITFLGFDLPVREVQVGDTLRLVTYWNANRIWGTSLDSQNRLTGTVYAGKRVRVQDEYTLAPGDVGDFQILIRGIELARVRVTPRDEIAHVGNISHRIDYVLGNQLGSLLHLIGYDLPQTKFRAGDSVPLTLYWRAESLVGKSFTVFVHLVGQQFNPKQNNPLWGQVDRVPSIPTTAWFPNEIVLDAYSVKIDSDAPPGTYQIEIGMYDAATGTRLPINSGGDSIIIDEIKIIP